MMVSALLKYYGISGGVHVSKVTRSEHRLKESTK